MPQETAAFYARRFTHETAVHRADATLALGAEFTLDQDVALDALDAWMELGSLPFHFESAVAVRGPLIELLLLVCQRRPVHGAGVEVLGDAELLDFWLERVSFG